MSLVTITSDRYHKNVCKAEENRVAHYQPVLAVPDQLRIRLCTSEVAWTEAYTLDLCPASQAFSVMFFSIWPLYRLRM